LCSSRHSTVVNCVIIYRVNGPLVAREPAVHAEQGSAAGRSSLANDVDSPEREREREQDVVGDTKRCCYIDCSSSRVRCCLAVARE